MISNMIKVRCQSKSSIQNCLNNYNISCAQGNYNTVDRVNYRTSDHTEYQLTVSLYILQNENDDVVKMIYPTDLYVTIQSNVQMT